MRARRPFILGVLLFLLTPGAQARWEKEDEAAAHYDEMAVAVTVNRDFSVETTQEFTATIDKQEAVSDFSVFRVQYVAPTTQVRILAARAISGGISYPLDPRTIEDKEVSSQSNGYDSLRELKVAFQQIAVGAKVQLKLWRKSQPEPFPQQVAEVFDLGEDYPVRSLRFDLNSTIPIQYKIHDPQHLLRAAELKIAGTTTLKINSAGTIFQRAVDEPGSYFTEPQVPVITVSNIPSWAEFGNPVAEKFSEPLRAPLPPLFADIANRAKEKTDPLDRIEAVLSGLQKDIHYLGSWKTVHGKFFPRSLADVATSRYGDCKDYATGAVAILRSLGFDAVPALTQVEVGSVNPDAPALKQSVRRLVGYQPPLPGSFFNHAIVKVKLDNKDLWLDPTSPIAYARGTPPHLLGVYALTLKQNAAAMEVIPVASARGDTVQIGQFLTVNSDRTVDEIKRIKVTGYAASALAFAEEKNKSSTKRLADLLYGKGTAASPAGEFSTDMGVAATEYETTTSAGAGVKFDYPQALYPYLNANLQTVGNLLLSTGRQATTTYIQGGTLVGTLPAPCKVDTHWYSVNRVFSQEGDATKVLEEVEIKAPSLTMADLQAVEMKTARETLQACLKSTTLIFQPQALVDAESKAAFKPGYQLTPWQIKRIKLRAYLEKLWVSARELLGKPIPPDHLWPLVQVDPGWSKGKSPEQLISKARTLIEEQKGNLLASLLGKFLLLEASHSTPNDPMILRLLSHAERNMGYIKNREFDPKALERSREFLYYGLARAPLDPGLNMGLATWMSIKGLKDARDQGDFALALDPSDDSSVGYLAMIYFYADRPDRALELEKAVKKKNYSLLENIYASLNRLDDANAAYQEEIAKEPGAWVYLNYANFLNSRGQYDQAIESAKKSIDISESGVARMILADAYVGKAGLLANDPSKLTEATTYYQKALEEDNSSEVAHQGMGWALYMAGTQANSSDLLLRSWKEYAIVQKINPRNMQAAITLGKIHQALAPNRGLAGREPPRLTAPLRTPSR